MNDVRFGRELDSWPGCGGFFGSASCFDLRWEAEVEGRRGLVGLRSTEDPSYTRPFRLGRRLGRRLERRLGSGFCAAGGLRWSKLLWVIVFHRACSGGGRADGEDSVKIAKRVAAVVTAVAIGLGVGVAEAQARPVVNQGDRVIVETSFTRGHCTVGYVDRATNRAIFSGHCTGYPGQRVTDAHGNYIGTVATLTFVASVKSQNDYAYISLRGGARAGRNGFSGDRMVHPSAVRPGETACSVGATTQRVMCAPVHSVRGHKIVVSGLTALRGGDSGGPIWIPNRGLVAIHSGEAGGKTLGSYPEYYFGPELLLPLLAV